MSELGLSFFATEPYFLRDKAEIQCGQKILIIGAAGSVGTFAVQFAKYYGADVTGVCSAANVELIKSLGADRVIDYSKQPFIEQGKTYDIILDAVGKSAFSVCKKALAPNGIYLTTVPSLGVLLRMLWTGRFSSKKAIFALANNSREDLIFLSDLMETGQIKTVIDRCYPLEQMVEAHRYIETGHKRGNVVIVIDQTM